MKIHLVRHAKTDPDSLSGKDFDRKLLSKGIAQANVLAFFFHENKIHLGFTYCSEAIRTTETLNILSFTNDLGKISFLKELYLADREVYLKLIWEQKHAKDLLIVGHNDGISSLASYLIEETCFLKTCGYVCIEFSANSWDEVSRGTGKLIEEFRPMVYLPD
jgi:phosphohistidine phosphatase